MAIGVGDLILNGAILGLLLGIVWSLRYIVLMDRKLSKMDSKIEHLVEKGISLDKKIEKMLLKKRK